MLMGGYVAYTVAAAAIAGTAAVSFGTIPLALILTGVAIGTAVKVYEYVDEKYDHKPSKKIRQFFREDIPNWFESTYNNIFGSTITEEEHCSHEVEPKPD